MRGNGEERGGKRTGQVEQGSVTKPATGGMMRWSDPASLQIYGDNYNCGVLGKL